MLGMFALGVSFLYGVAFAAAITVAFTVIAALTLLPALLGFFGTRVLRRRERRAVGRAAGSPTATSRPVGALGRIVHRRPRRSCGRSGVMVVLAIPFFSMRLGSADAGCDPASSTTHKAYELLARGFGPGYNGPLQLVAQIRLAEQRADFVRVVRAVAATPGVVSAGPARSLPGVDGTARVAVSDVYPRGSPQDVSTAACCSSPRHDDTDVPRRDGRAGAGRRPDGGLR